jgi:hypothetical protein
MTLEEALTHAEEAREVGYLNRYPVACIVLAEALIKAREKLKKTKDKLDNSRNELNILRNHCIDNEEF